MSVRIDRLTRSPAWSGAVVLGTALLVALAVRAGASAPDASAALVVLDVSVGIAFVAAGTIARGSVAERALVMGVGLTWLAGSVWPVVRVGPPGRPRSGAHQLSLGQDPIRVLAPADRRGGSHRLPARSPAGRAVIDVVAVTCAW